MADKNPYGLRNADIENLDLSEFAKDYSEDELAAVRAGLMQKRQQQQEQFNALPVFDQAKIYAGEKFGGLVKTIEENPHIAAGIGLGIGSYKVGEKAIDAGTSVAKSAKSLYDRMINKPSDSVVAPTTSPVTETVAETFTPEKVPTAEQVRIEKQRAAQAMIEGRPVVAGTGPVTQSVIDNTSPVPETFTPEKVPTAEQATKEMVESGKLKGGKAYGSTDVLDQAILKSEPLIQTEKQLEAAGQVKGAAVPSRRTPKEAVVFKQETPFNKAYNQYSQRLGGMGAPEKSPLQTQFDTAWEDIYNNVFKGEMPKSQGGNPAGWDKAEKLVRSQPEKYSAIIKHLDETAEKYGKSYTSEKGFASLSGMANLAGNALGALGLTQAYKQGKKTGDWSDFGLGVINQVVGNVAPRAAVPLALMTPSAVSSGTLDSPEARELLAKAQARQVGAGRGIAPPSAYMR